MKLFQSKTKEVESDIDKFIDNIENTALIFEQAIKDYLKGHVDRFEERFREIDQLEHDSDDLRRDIKYKLYSYLLIPDARGDVLGLM